MHLICPRKIAAVLLALTAVSILLASASAESPSTAAATRPADGSRAHVDAGKLPVLYGQTMSDRGHVFPGFFDEKTEIFYQWKGVALESGPRLIWVTNAPIPVDLDDKRQKVELVPPPVEYLALDGGKAAPGWYDHTSGYFYRWRGVEVTAAGLSPRDRATLHDPKERITVVLVAGSVEYADAAARRQRIGKKPDSPNGKGGATTRAAGD